MKLSDFDYKLPEGLIAQTPKKPRDGSRLLVLGRESGEIEHRHFLNIIDFLKPGDLLILNDSKVFPARLMGEKEATGGKIEILLNHQISDGHWQCVGKGLKIGAQIKFGDSKLRAVVIDKRDKTYRVKFNVDGEEFFNIVNKIGLTPLPPYIRRKLITNNEKLITNEKELLDKELYQTVYARERGSVAAPTAGLHFTKELLCKIKEKGVEIEYITLHVGLGTFLPVKEDEIEKHKIHKEYFSVKKSILDQIKLAKEENRRVIAVGTTSTRVLETVWDKLNVTTTDFFHPTSLGSYEGHGGLSSDKDLSGWTDIFIYPGYKFLCVDAMITNFHLPKSTLLMLISAFAGEKNIQNAYQTAIENKYRFYSFGDAMIIISQ